MFIYLNGEREYIEENMSISKLLQEKKSKREIVTVEHNGQIIDREKFKDTLLNKGDGVEFVYYIGRGWNSEFGIRNIVLFLQKIMEWVQKQDTDFGIVFLIPHSQFREEETHG